MLQRPLLLLLGLVPCGALALPACTLPHPGLGTSVDAAVPTTGCPGSFTLGGGGQAGAVGMDDSTCSTFSPTPVNVLLPVAPAATALVDQMTQVDKINILSGDHVATPNWSGDYAFRSLGVENLGVTKCQMRDGPRGMRSIKSGEIGTTWAAGIARGASFDVNLEYLIGKYQGLDMRAARNDLALAPVINTLRHPRWARAQETYGEDPVLLGELGAAYVLGMQNEGATMACPKHFVGNDTDNNRLVADPIYDEQTLRENYVLPFEITIKKSDPACIMAAYNMVNDTYSCENKHILTDILRTELGWGGFVLSDWEAAQAGHGAASINAGLDLEMPIPRAFKTLTSDLSSSSVTAATLTQAATRIINARVKFKNFESSYVAGAPEYNLASCTPNVALARQSALEGAVLLKNDSILPLGAKASVAGTGLANVTTVAIVGPDWNLPKMPNNTKVGDVSGLGDRGSSQTNPPHVVSYVDGLKAKGVTVTTSADASKAAGADVVIIPVSMANEDEGEHYGTGGDREDMTLAGVHPKHWSTKPSAFIKSVAAINPNVIVLLNVGSAIIVEDWIDSVKGVVQTFYPGQEGGAAIADLLFGDANFSAKLPFTVGVSEADYPVFGNTAARLNVDYLHGYRWFEKNAKPVRYWFGYGLSYTTYSYSGLKVLCSSLSENGRLNVEVSVTNDGPVAGEEIVQLYIGYPNTTARRPLKELKAFTRVALAPGEKKTVQLHVPVKDMRYWGTSGWTIEKVAHKVLVGPSADPTKLLSADFTIQ